MKVPYIGITDFTSFEQVQHMQKVFQEHKQPGSKRVLHVGAMMSFKTLYGHLTQWAEVFPPKETLKTIFQPCGDVYNCLHYADYEEWQTASADLELAIKYAGPFVHAVQLDMIWPAPMMIELAILSTPKIEVILQIGRQAMKVAGNDPNMVVCLLDHYSGLIDRVLLDKSGGHGIEMSVPELLPYARAIRKRFPHFGLVVAGGLGPDSIGLVEPLLDEFPNISIGAQGKLRPSGSALDPIDWNMAERYLIEALKLLK